MNNYLAQHPQVFMSRTKELHYFGKDLHFAEKRLSKEAYLSYFKEAYDSLAVGESSVWYLYSSSAAAEIAAFAPCAKIIIMLRNPIDMIYSLHSEFLYSGNEEVEDFVSALALESCRRRGQHIPQSANFPGGLQYRETARYASQVKRYFDNFGRERVKVLLYEDFREDVGRTYVDVLEFLGLDTSFRPEFTLVNPNKRVRSKFLRELILRPKGLPRILGKAVTPAKLRHTIMRRLHEWNVVYSTRIPLEVQVRQRLLMEFVPEIERMSKLLCRDLSCWTTLENVQRKADHILQDSYGEPREL